MPKSMKYQLPAELRTAYAAYLLALYAEKDRAVAAGGTKELHGVADAFCALSTHHKDVLGSLQGKLNFAAFK